MTTPRKISALLMWGVIGLLAGCQSFSRPTFWPFPEVERTSYRTPAMRADAIRQIASKSSGVDAPEQRQITDQLARQIQIEPDPLVRQAIIQSIAEFRTPLAQQVLEAGVGDEDKGVRIASCVALGRRGEAASVARLGQTLQAEKDIDVRLAAAEALGKIDSPESIQALVVALDDRNPGLQYVGVKSLQSLTGANYGGDVEAWRQLATGGTPPPAPVPSLAERIRAASPF